MPKRKDTTLFRVYLVTRVTLWVRNVVHWCCIRCRLVYLLDQSRLLNLNVMLRLNRLLGLWEHNMQDTREAKHSDTQCVSTQSSTDY